MADRILVTTTENVPGQRYEIIGEVFGLTTQSKNVIKNIGAGLKNIVGGQIKSYSELLSEARDTAISRLRNNAEEMGADAVVMMRFDSDSIGQDMETVAAYGTAVKFVNQNNQKSQCPFHFVKGYWSFSYDFFFRCDFFLLLETSFCSCET